MRITISLTRAVLVGAALLLAAAPARAQWQLESKDGSSNLKLGFLAQGQGEFLDTSDGEHVSQNLYLRRFRLLFGGKVSEKWTFFFETDSPNIGKGDVAGTAAKNADAIYLQDAFVTYNHHDAFKVEAGLMLPALCHNCAQSAATLLPVDYSPYSFLTSAPLQGRVGRDYGVQLRGYPAKKHLEYRLHVLQGLRGPQSRNALRVGGRLVWYPFEAETGFFYSGTNHASKKILAIGASFDAQKSYKSYAFDVYFDHPVAGKNGVTLQGDWLHQNGDLLLATLPEQNSYLFEAGFYSARTRLAPFVQYERQDFKRASGADKEQFQIGLAWWLKGHNRSLKAGFGQQHVHDQPDRNQFQVQLQVFMF